jgi:hypothetical protein
MGVKKLPRLCQQHLEEASNKRAATFVRSIMAESGGKLLISIVVLEKLSVDRLARQERRIP